MELFHIDQLKSYLPIRWPESGVLVHHIPTVYVPSLESSPQTGSGNNHDRTLTTGLKHP